MSNSEASVDCLIVGGGPAGLTAAIYAARFRLRTLVIDGGLSRAALIPCTRNHAGFPDGISGIELLSKMRAQAKRYGAEVRPGRALAIGGQAGAFSVRLADGSTAQARAVILATGVSNHRPPMAEALHAEALSRGLLRYCPVCDGFEVTDKPVGVVGSGERALKEATFLRAYTKQVTIVPDGPEDRLDDAQKAELETIGVSVAPGPAKDFRIEEDGLSLDSRGTRLTFQSVYPALGSTVHSDLAAAMGAALTGDGCIKVDSHQRTSVPGLYAAGDVVIGLDQISHAMGEAGVAATTVRNDLAAALPRLR